MRPHSILVVDDSAAMRELLQVHLTNAGYDVAVAEDAIVAGQRLLRSPPSLLIVDVNMPYMNGVEFVATLLADSSVPYVPVILISGTDISEQAALLGAVVLNKPFFVGKLLEVVRGQLSRPHAPDSDPQAIPEATTSVAAQRAV
jgi:DNA-binding response OmpR family regulator